MAARLRKLPRPLMFEHWMRFAPTMSNRLGLDTATIVRAHDVVCKTMGQHWLEQQNRKRPISNTHPLYIALKGPTEGSVLEVLHLAAYLFAFCEDPGLRESISALRDADKYTPAVIELDLAWKFRNAGADVHLFPPTPKGKGDFAAIIDGVERIIEISGFPSDTLRDDGMSFLYAMSESFVSVMQKSGLVIPVSLELDMHEITGGVRPAVHAAIKDLFRAFRQNNGDTRVEQAYDFGTVAVRRAVIGESPSGDSKWTKAVRVRTPLTQTSVPGWAYLCDRSASPDPFVRLRSKLKQKAPQLSRCTDGVIILDIEALGLEVINDRELLRSVAEDFSRNHRSTTGVAIVVRPEKTNGQRGVSGHYFPLTDTALSAAFWERMVAIDDKANLLSELQGL